MIYERMAETRVEMRPHHSTSMMSAQGIEDSSHQKRTGHIVTRIATHQPIGYNLALASAARCFFAAYVNRGASDYRGIHMSAKSYDRTNKHRYSQME